MCTLAWKNQIIQGDALETLRGLPNGCVQTCITSPPYYAQRDYQVDGQIGLEETPTLYVQRLVEVFHEVQRVLRDDGTLWCNIADTYANDQKQSPEYSPKHQSGQQGERRPRRYSGLPGKNLIGIPWRLAFALQDDGWILRSEIIWQKENPLPEPVQDRPSKAHETIFLLAKKQCYFYDAEAIREPLKPKTLTTYGCALHVLGNDPLGKVKAANWHQSMTERRPRLNDDGEIAGANKKDVWSCASEAYHGQHYAPFPQALILPCVLAGSSSRACAHCGAPWKRTTRRVGGTWQQRKAKGAPSRYALEGVKDTPAGTEQMGAPATITTGWQPSCACLDQGQARCVVLDPFMGSGTTALVALKQGRDFLGVELNPEYIAQAQQRIAAIQPEIWTLEAQAEQGKETVA